MDIGDPGLAGLANAPRAAERISPKDVRVKAFMMTVCTFGYLRSRTGVLEKGFVFSANLQYVWSAAILYRLDFSPWSSQIGPQSEFYELLKAGFLGKLATSVRYMGTFGHRTGRSPHTFGLFQHAKRPSSATDGICSIDKLREAIL